MNAHQNASFNASSLHYFKLPVAPVPEGKNLIVYIGQVSPTPGKICPMWGCSLRHKPGWHSKRVHPVQKTC